ncbi:MAG: CYTH domain-containing protein [Deltaproteobacteria bacterium]|nr:CYTH domain-containing protein [Deltaproteobacteria bacterium]
MADVRVREVGAVAGDERKNVEREIKLALADRAAYEVALRVGEPGGIVCQDNRFYDRPDHALRVVGWNLRLRREWTGTTADGPARRFIVTAKGASHREGWATVRPEKERVLERGEWWALMEGRVRLGDVAPEVVPPPVMERYLTDLRQIGWFSNLRVSRRIRLDGRDFILEVDATRFACGRTEYEVELELPQDLGRRQASLVEHELVDLLSRWSVSIAGPGRGKFSRARRYAKEAKKMIDVPARGLPLRFEVLSKVRVWGGHKLARQYGKPPAGDQPCGETWELVDLPDDQSKVASGPLAGVALHELVDEHRDWLMGRADLLEGRFPLLLKLIDAATTLSVQVHPDREVAARLSGRPKTECWVVLDVAPQGCLYLGLKPGVTPAQLEDACAGPSLEPLLNKVSVQPFDVVFIPAGTVHAIGGGLVLAELQQASDTTYRLHDWGRVGLDGKPRQLHVAQALESIHFDQGDDPPWMPQKGPGIVVDDAAFRLDLLSWTGKEQDDRDDDMKRARSIEHLVPVVLLCLEGEMDVEAGGVTERLGPGQCCLVPAASKTTRITSKGAGRVLVGRPGMAD